MKKIKMTSAELWTHPDMVLGIGYIDNKGKRIKSKDYIKVDNKNIEVQIIHEDNYPLDRTLN